MKSRTLNIMLFFMLTLITVSCVDDKSITNESFRIVENNSFFQLLSRYGNIYFVIGIFIASLITIIQWIKKMIKNGYLYIFVAILSCLAIIGLYFVFEYFGWIMFVDDFSLWLAGITSYTMFYVIAFLPFKNLKFIPYLVDLLLCISIFLYMHFFIDQVVILNFIIPIIILYIVIQIIGFIEDKFEVGIDD